MKKLKFVIYMSVFLSLFWTVVPRHNGPVVSTGEGHQIATPQIANQVDIELSKEALIYDPVGIKLDEVNKYIVHAASVGHAVKYHVQPTSYHTTTLYSDDIWYRLAMCETGGKMNNPNTGNGYSGYFQFTDQTWHSVGGSGSAWQHSYEEQKSLAQILQQRSGWGQWPRCSRVLGLR